MNTVKTYLLPIFGALSSVLAYLFGGWNEFMTILVILMMIDYATGLLVAGVFNTSPKSATGALSSRASFQGLVRKMMILCFVIVGALADRATGMDFAKNAVILSFMANELLSIIENAGLMGVPIPSAIKKAIEVLKEKAEVPDHA